MDWLASLTSLMSIILYLLAGLVALVIAGFSLVSLQEGERRAAIRAAASALLLSLPFLVAAILSPLVQGLVLLLTLILVLTAIIFFLLPGRKVDISGNEPNERYDERDIPFARIWLTHGSPQYDSYYQMRPERQAFDDRLREKPGLLSLEARLADPLHFAAADGSFFLTEALAPAVDGEVNPERTSLPPAEMSAYLKSLAQYYGARDVGITALRPHHVYSHIGRGQGVYGDPIPVEGRWAIAFTVEMDFAMTGAGPHPPAVMESAHQYVESARTAVQLAAAIRLIGYPARAHIDGNYRVICPLVARDAGLGEIGRMGLLMTPSLGPRIRLGVVTTDVELIPDEYEPSQSVNDFCTICAKCADCCPPQAIPHGPRTMINGTQRWQIDADKCFQYWNVVGTDCARCMAVCPYSHPDSSYHNMTRWGIKRSWGFRRMALWMDDFFYGEKPPSRTPPAWTKHS